MPLVSCQDVSLSQNTVEQSSDTLPLSTVPVSKVMTAVRLSGLSWPVPRVQPSFCPRITTAEKAPGAAPERKTRSYSS